MKRFLTFVFVATLLSLSEQSSDSSDHAAEDESSVRLQNGGPPPNYHYIRGVGYYKFETTQRSFLNAQRYCQNSGANLAILNSQAEAEAVANYFRSLLPNENELVRIGFGDFFGKGELFTVFGKSISCTGYLDWKAGEPSMRYERNCGWINVNQEMGTGCCDCNKMFLCEYKAQKNC
ncbi:hypothetical protein J437_LFUL019056 [Ladona fulva]|uniref:C-type lectin domain-containing protein n=1 Tax=Ladona fulva TaxID=123851 RepID=A0A8K0KRG2_LADFU|nr:hypothetical protein J437_LFUL019056 [Ladona fulva]